MYILYDLALFLLVPLAVVFSLSNRRLSANLDRLWWRLGFGRCPELLDLRGRPRIWIHAASFGEVAALPRLARGIRAAYPGACLVVSIMTAAGRQAARSMLEGGGVDRCFYLPYDLPWAARKVTGLVRPDLFITTETELWPNLLRQAKRRGARLLMINGRISIRSMGFYRAFRRFFRRILADYDRYGMIGPGDAERLLAMGAAPEKVLVSGNMKFDLVAERVRPGLAEEMRLRLHLPIGTRIMVAGSTRQGEEEQILEAYRAILADHPDLRLIIAPRHIDRAQAVAALVDAAGFTPVLRSKFQDNVQQDDGPGTPRATGDPPSPGLRRADERPSFARASEGGRATEILILDTMGELFAVYGLAKVVFCGGSLVPLGGQSPLEPAAWGKVALYGPSMENFPEARELLEEAGAALAVQDAAELATRVKALLADPDDLRRRGEAGRQAVAAHRGASERNLALVKELLTGSSR